METFSRREGFSCLTRKEVCDLSTTNDSETNSTRKPCALPFKKFSGSLHQTDSKTLTIVLVAEGTLHALGKHPEAAALWKHPANLSEDEGLAFLSLASRCYILALPDDIHLDKFIHFFKLVGPLYVCIEVITACKTNEECVSVFDFRSMIGMCYYL